MKGIEEQNQQICTVSDSFVKSGECMVMSLFILLTENAKTVGKPDELCI